MHRSDEAPEPPSLRWRATLGLLKRLPQGALSRGFGRVADVPIPPSLRRSVLGAFARAVDGGEQDEAHHLLGESGQPCGTFAKWPV